MIEFKKHSGVYSLYATQELPIPLEEAWAFFSSPKNLQKITPPHMGFKITSRPEENIYSGQIITYHVHILPGVKTNWVTEITQAKHLSYFIDEQRYGPYSMWHHEHIFEALPNGNTLMKDKITYKVPFGFLGHIAQSLFIKRQLTSIFEFRFKILEETFQNK